MVNNKTKASMENGTEKQLPNELFQLRDILFGEDKREFEAHFNDLEKKTEQQIDQLSASLNNDIKELRQSMDKGFALLSEQLSDIDHSHNEREDDIKHFADNTASRLEQFELHSKQTTESTLAKINEESKHLSNHFDNEIKQTLEKLSEVSDRLQSSKTDRKLLAQLLNSAAQSLEQVDE